MAMLILLVLLIFFAALGIPLAFAIGASCVTYILIYKKRQSFLRENPGLCNSMIGNVHCLVKGRVLWYSYGSKGTGCKELCVILGVCDGKEI